MLICRITLYTSVFFVFLSRKLDTLFTHEKRHKTTLYETKLHMGTRRLDAMPVALLASEP